MYSALECPEIDVDHATLSTTERTDGVTVTLTCDTDYELSNGQTSQQFQCDGASQTWSPTTTGVTCSGDACEFFPRHVAHSHNNQFSITLWRPVALKPFEWNSIILAYSSKRKGPSHT